jgi:SNF2 family DNA or RNA helicase
LFPFSPDTAAPSGVGFFFGGAAMTPRKQLDRLFERIVKSADINPDVKLQPHQSQLMEEAEEKPQRKLLYHSLGSGKTLSAIAMAEAQKRPYTAVVPAALRPNWGSELSKFTNKKVPQQVVSYTALAKKVPLQDPHTIIFDEAHRLRNSDSAQSTQAVRAAAKAKQVILLSGSPLVNDPSDLAVPTSILTGKPINPDQFRAKFVGSRTVEPGFFDKWMGAKPGTEEYLQNKEELKALLRGHVDYYAPTKSNTPVHHEEHTVEMGDEQTQLYRHMWDQLPFHLRWKLKNDFPMSGAEAQSTVSFLSGPRQVGLSPYPYMAKKDPLRAFAMSPKLGKAHTELQKHLTHPDKKALIFSNFIDAGLTPYAAKLKEQNIPHAVFHGGLSDKQRQQLVNDYNSGKIRVALIGPSGSEGLSFRGTQLVQLLDPHWNQTRTNQQQGRGLRFDSHTGLPEDLKNVTVQRFRSRLPSGLTNRLLTSVGFDRSKHVNAADDFLEQMTNRKEKLNQQFADVLREIGSRKER